MSDWYRYRLKSDAREERALPDGAMSGAWARSFVDAEQTVHRLMEIRNAVRNIVRVHGAPPHCTVELAVMGQVGAGATCFDDAPKSFQQPRILLDKGVYETVDPAAALDVYCAVGLHEAGHALHTREFYRRAPKGRRRIWENLWEDERIEELIRRDSPGFASYLRLAKRELFEKQELGQSLAAWRSLPDLDVLAGLMFAFIRCPKLIDRDLQAWAAVNGECVFATLRSLFPGGPRDERDVAEFAERMERLYDRLAKLYDKEGEFAKRLEGGGEKQRELLERLRRQWQAEEEDRRLQATLKDLESMASGVPASPELAAEAEWSGLDWSDAARRLERALDQEQRRFRDRFGRRFSLLEVERLLRRANQIGRPLDLGETRCLVQAERERVTFGEKWTWSGERRTVITHPLPDHGNRAKLEAARRLVQGEIAAMRQVFRLRLGRRAWHETERSEGRLHRRMLGRAAVTDRVFRRRHERSDRGLALCLLLDESGSMGTCDCPSEVGGSSRAATTLRVATLVAEALKNLPGVELEIYSHSSCGTNHADCLIRYLYGRQNPNLHSLGSYGRGSQNYDHQAILTAGKLFDKNTTLDNRLLLVLSDGAPAGWNYGGSKAMTATRDAVREVRRRGTRVFGVAINAHNAEAIYGERQILKFTNLPTLVQDMRRLITGIIRQATEGIA